MVDQLKTEKENFMRTTAPTGRARTQRWTLALAFSLLAIVAAVTAIKAAPAEADYGDGVAIRYFEAYPSTTQAGGHPDFYLEFNVDNRFSPVMTDPNDPTKFHPCYCNEARDIVVNLPAGFIGNPHATPQCTAIQFAFDECPIDSQVGITSPSGCLGPALCKTVAEPIYNMVPAPGVAGMTGFPIPIVNSPLYTFLTARTGGDYGLRATIEGNERILPVPHYLQILWGVPADPIHDIHRYKKPCYGEACIFGPPTTGYSSNSPLVPFLSNPTTCGDPLSIKLDITAYDRGHTSAEIPWPTTTGCSQLAFNPSLSATPTTKRADTPSGIDVNLTVPQTQSPTVPSPSAIKATTMTLPPGFTINSNAADGKTSCSDAAAKFGTEDEAECPEFAKVGTLEVHSAVLPGVLPGAVYLGEPKPGNRYRIFLVADGFGLHAKLPGSVIPDPKTGQVVVSFQDLPQAPFEEFNLHFFGSERGSLATPEKCGQYPVVTTFTPWNKELPDQTSTQFFTIDSGPNGEPCPGATRPFDPSFEAASTDNTAGAHTPFSVDLVRPDGNQLLDGLTVSTPPGFSGVLKGIPYCPESALTQLSTNSYAGLSELTSPACPTASQIGTAISGAGAGSKPLYVPGKVFLAGPYKGAPLSLVVVIPAVSGPYDLGNVAVRAAIKVDPVTAQVTTVSDPFPSILEGIPLRTRSIQVLLDRPKFALNPTNCKPHSVNATISGSEGALVSRSSHYEVANCAILPFGPKLSLKLTGSTKQAGNPALTATLTAKPGEAAISRAQVTLPPTELVDNAHIKTICTRVQFNEGKTPGEKCPSGSVLGFARAETPLLDDPLEGPIYLRSTPRAGLPDLVVALNGQINIVLDARIDSVRGRLRTTFETVPDAPVTKFVLSFYGGNRGIIENSPRLCARTQHFTAAMTGQNGATFNRRPVLSTPCGSKARHKRHSKKAGR